MNRRALLALVLAWPLPLPAANLKGKWVARIPFPAQRTGETQDRSLEVVLDLKQKGDRLTGTVTNVLNGKRGRPQEIWDGKVEGDRFSFVTLQPGDGGERKVLWEGLVQGREIRGTRHPEGVQRGLEFVARKR